MADAAVVSSNGVVNEQSHVAQDSSSPHSEDHVFQVSPTAPKKRTLTSEETASGQDVRESKRRKGTAPVRAEYLILEDDGIRKQDVSTANDDDAEAFHHKDRQPSSSNARKREKHQGQNKARKFGSSRDEVGLCSTRVKAPEFSPEECSFGDKCRFEHDLRKYIKDYKREDLQTFDGVCPVWEALGTCNDGWKCRFVGSHSKEIRHEDGRLELVLAEGSKDESAKASEEGRTSVVNAIDVKDRITLTKKKFPTPKTDTYLQYLNESSDKTDRRRAQRQQDNGDRDHNSSSPEAATSLAENRANYSSSALLPSEKRRLYFGPDTPVLAPLTTQGNLPFRRLCVSLGASFTYSEMAMSFPLLNGHKPEWALVKAHASELQPPTFTAKAIPDLPKRNNIVYDYGYNHATDLRFSAQISASKPWTATKATEVLTTLLPNGFRSIDLNCGCPIDLVYREGAGSALMDSPAKLSKILRGMNIVSDRTPVTCKIRMGTKDKVPTAQKLVERLILGSQHAGNGVGEPSAGVAAITLHGRSRQQRYTRQADWDYIAQTSALIQNLNLRTGEGSPSASLISSLGQKTDALTDTIHAPDDRDLPNGQSINTSTASSHTHSVPTFFLGNGDVYSPTHYNQHLTSTGCDAIMLARGALIKPWLFEEISTQQTLDKRSTERLAYISQFCKFGLEAWGSDEVGVGTTRRFLLEWLSFTCRYVPVGLLEVLPPELNERAPRYRGRDELETLMASDDYRDWIKISEMFLGPAHKDFRFEPKHKSNSYEIQAEG